MTASIHAHCPSNPKNAQRPSFLTFAENARSACQQAILLSLNAALQPEGDPQATNRRDQMVARIRDLESQLSELLANCTDSQIQATRLDQMLKNFRQLGLAM
jgi:hypothetical protein